MRGTQFFCCLRLTTQGAHIKQLNYVVVIHTIPMCSASSSFLFVPHLSNSIVVERFGFVLANERESDLLQKLIIKSKFLFNWDQWKYVLYVSIQKRSVAHVKTNFIEKIMFLVVFPCFKCIHSVRHFILISSKFAHRFFGIKWKGAFFAWHATKGVCYSK